MNTALLSAAATALTVKAALSGSDDQGQPRLEAAVEPAPSIVGDDAWARPDHPHSRALVHKILVEVAVRHQVQTETATEAGPALLGREVNLDDPYDNADVGVAILRQDIDAFNGPQQGLAAYYQGPTSLKADGMFPDTQRYVEGILDLASRMNP